VALRGGERSATLPKVGKGGSHLFFYFCKGETSKRGRKGGEKGVKIVAERKLTLKPTHALKTEQNGPSNGRRKKKREMRGDESHKLGVQEN